MTTNAIAKPIPASIGFVLFYSMSFLIKSVNKTRMREPRVSASHTYPYMGKPFD